MSYRQIEVTVNIDDFDDADILEAASRIMSVRGRSAMLGGGPETPGETLHRLVGDLASAIVFGDPTEALLRLDDLVGDNRNLRDAIDIGRRRVRR